MKPIIFEICCGSAADAISAYKGGADRVELNSDLFHGGLTPSVGALRIVKKHAPKLPVMCMVRPREGGFCYSDIEFETMLEDAGLLLENGADGIVFGFLKEDGCIDADRCRQMLSLIGNRQSVFHRAIDVVPDVFKALDTLIDLGFTRVLTSGQRPAALEGADTIRDMIRHADGQIEILPGAGIRPENARTIIDRTGAVMLHASRRKEHYDLSCSNNPLIHFNAAEPQPEDIYKVTDEKAVAAFISSVEKGFCL